jgi:hypothetical protein
MDGAGSGGAIQRATFFEGQILSAADLNAVVDGARGAMAQHKRYLHLPGIGEGLQLVATERTTLAGDTYQDVVVQPGLAVDGNGRHLVVREAERLSEDGFDQLNVAINDPLAWYPVFLTGRDESPPTSSAPQVACASNAPTRVVELAEITFGRVEDASDPHNTASTDIAALPGSDGTAAPWRVLLGFVQWSAAIKRFSRVADSYDGIGRDYAGVRADEVVARGGKLSLRSAAKGENGTLVAEIEGAADGELRFGAQNSSGKVVPVFTVNAKGDLFAAGKISGAVASGAQIQTGSAFDGMLLPLPPGISQAQIDAGEVTIQGHVTPHYGIPALATLPAGNRWLMTPIECRVVDRRVFCRVRWEATNAMSAPQELPGVCDYTLMAFTAP